MALLTKISAKLTDTKILRKLFQSVRSALTLDVDGHLPLNHREKFRKKAPRTEKKKRPGRTLIQ